MTKYAIFPLPIVILPQGRTRLRIFEPRYLRMVKQTINDIGFVITSLNPTRSDEQMSDIGSLVKIIDFSQLEDGMLSIDVEAIELVNVTDIEQQDDKLHIGNISPRAHWPLQLFDDRGLQLSALLQQLFQQYSNIGDLYPNQQFDDPNWVCCRWLEILPLEPMQKMLFYQADSYDQAIDFLATLLLARKN